MLILTNNYLYTTKWQPFSFLLCFMIEHGILLNVLINFNSFVSVVDSS